MRTALLFTALAVAGAAPAHAQLVVRAGGDVVAGSYRLAGAEAPDLALGVAGLFTVRTPGAVAAYGALRPELTALTEGGTGYYQDRDVLYYGDDGLPVYGGGTCRRVLTDDPSPGACGTSVVRGALSAETGLRLALGDGAALVGVGLRGGGGEGVYGAVTGQLAGAAYGRLEVGTGHVMLGLGFGRF